MSAGRDATGIEFTQKLCPDPAATLAIIFRIFSKPESPKILSNRPGRLICEPEMIHQRFLT